MLVVAPTAPPVVIARIDCRQTTISKVQYPTGPAGYQHGTITLANGWYALLWQGQAEDGTMNTHLIFPPPSHFHQGDKVMACLDTIPFTTATRKQYISIFDLTTDTHLESIQGPEGA